MIKTRQSTNISACLFQNVAVLKSRERLVLGKGDKGFQADPISVTPRQAGQVTKPVVHHRGLSNKQNTG